MLCVTTIANVISFIKANLIHGIAISIGHLDNVFAITFHCLYYIQYQNTFLKSINLPTLLSFKV